MKSARAALILLCLLAPATSSAQDENDDPSDSVATQTGSDPATETPGGRVQRLGDVTNPREWKPGLQVPGTEVQPENLPQLPDPQQQDQLHRLLSRQAASPEDVATLEALNALLAEILLDADGDLNGGRFEEARMRVAAVESIAPGHAGLPAVRAKLADGSEVEKLLLAAEAAFAEGRIDRPERESAWDYYRQVLDSEPGNVRALQGLEAVQQALAEQAVATARRGDFDTAERMIEDAAFVRPETEFIDAARLEIGAVKQSHAEDLESRAVSAMDSGNFDTAERVLIDLVALGGQSQRVNQLRRRMEEARIYGGFSPGQIIRDHFLNRATWAPESVVVLAGSFNMGSPESEQGRSDNESPAHRVTFRRGFAIGRREVSIEEFRMFVNRSGYRTDAERTGSSTVYDQFSGRLTEKKGVFWEMDYEGNEADPNLPVVHVSWNDAQAYVEWLARSTGKSYRLPSEAEFEYALRSGTTTRYWWGNGSPGSPVENLTGDGDSSRTRRLWSVSFPNYTDNFWGPAPVASFKPNPFGLFDMGGNVVEWVRDCWHETYVRAPADGSAWVNPGCTERSIRGGYWASSPDHTRSAYRRFAKADFHDARIGFRVARDL